MQDAICSMLSSWIRLSAEESGNFLLLRTWFRFSVNAAWILLNMIEQRHEHCLKWLNVWLSLSRCTTSRYIARSSSTTRFWLLQAKVRGRCWSKLTKRIEPRGREWFQNAFWSADQRLGTLPKTTPLGLFGHTVQSVMAYYNRPLLISNKIYVQLI